MKVRNWIETVNGIRKQQGEAEAAIEKLGTGYPVEVLQSHVEELDKEALMVEEYVVRPVAQVIKATVNNIPVIKVGATQTIPVEATLSNGDLTNPADLPNASILFVDFDASFNNAGYIKQMDASKYSGKVDRTLTITKTTNGFDVFDDLKTQGLMVVDGSTVISTLDYAIVDKDGKDIGIYFKESGTAVGDNWRVMVLGEASLASASIADEAIATVDGLVITGVSEGKTTVTVTAGGTVVTKDVEVSL